MHNATNPTQTMPTLTQTKPLITAYWPINQYTDQKTLEEINRYTRSADTGERQKGRFKRALLYITSGYYRLAHADIKDAIELFPDNPIFHTVQAELLAMNDDDLEEAHLSAQRAMAIVDQYITHGRSCPTFIYSCTVSARISLLVAEHQKQRLVETARTTLKKAIKINPQDPHAKKILDQLSGETSVVSPRTPSLPSPLPQIPHAVPATTTTTQPHTNTTNASTTSQVSPTSSTPGNNTHGHLVSTIFKQTTLPLLSPLPKPKRRISAMRPTPQPHSKGSTTTSTQIKPLVTDYFPINDKLSAEDLQLTESTNKDDKAKGYFKKTLHFIKKGHYSLARVLIHLAIQSNRSIPEYHSIQAELLVAINDDLEEAHESAQQAVMLINADIKNHPGASHSKFSYSHAVLAKILLLVAEYQKQRLVETARTTLKKALKINPQDPHAKKILDQLSGEISVVSPRTPQVQPPPFGNAATTFNSTSARAVPKTTNPAIQKTSNNHSGQGRFTVGKQPTFTSLTRTLYLHLFQSTASQQTTLPLLSPLPQIPHAVPATTTTTQSRISTANAGTTSQVSPMALTPQQITAKLSDLNASLLSQISRQESQAGSNRTSNVYPTSSTPRNNRHAHNASTLFKHPRQPLLSPLPQPISRISAMRPTTQPHSKGSTTTAATPTPTRQQSSSTAYPIKKEPPVPLRFFEPSKIKKEPSETTSKSHPAPATTGQQHSYNLRKRKQPQTHETHAPNNEEPANKRPRTSDTGQSFRL